MVSEFDIAGWFEGCKSNVPGLLRLFGVARDDEE